MRWLTLRYMWGSEKRLILFVKLRRSKLDFIPKVKREFKQETLILNKKKNNNLRLVLEFPSGNA